jgi:hypothetical protein
MAKEAQLVADDAEPASLKEPATHCEQYASLDKAGPAAVLKVERNTPDSSSAVDCVQSPQGVKYLRNVHSLFLCYLVTTYDLEPGGKENRFLAVIIAGLFPVVGIFDSSFGINQTSRRIGSQQFDSPNLIAGQDEHGDAKVKGTGDSHFLIANPNILCRCEGHGGIDAFGLVLAVLGLLAGRIEHKITQEFHSHVASGRGKLQRLKTGNEAGKLVEEVHCYSFCSVTDLQLIT